MDLLVINPLKRFFFFSLFWLLLPLYSQESICIVTGKTGIGFWDPDRIGSGITGSEEAVIYLSQELALLGYKVLVFADIPPNSRHSLPEANPRFVGFDFRPSSRFDIAISWRMPEIGTLLREYGRRVYFWPHDLCKNPIPIENADAFDDVLWISQSQRKQWSEMNPAFARFTHIFGNGIIPEQFDEIQERKNPYSCIYASSYDRGLEVLLGIWPAVKKEFPLATLDIYYGWRNWAGFSPFEEAYLRAQITNLSFLDVREHGLVGHRELNLAYGQASFWTYPCTSLPVETFCISALRAQFSGAVPVIISGSALKETVRHGYFCKSPDEYLATLLSALRHAEEISLKERKQQREFILKEYTWKKIALKWKELFEAIQ